MLRGLDRALGTIVSTLEEQSLAESTLIIFANDNGDYAGNGPFRGGKGQVSEGGIRVPLIVKWQERLPAGVEYHELVSALDILPTAVVAAGGGVDPAWKLDGVDLIPHFAGQKSEAPHDRLCSRIGNESALRQGLEDSPQRRQWLWLQAEAW